MIRLAIIAAALASPLAVADLPRRDVSVERTAPAVLAGAPVYRVGPGCEYATIQSALDAVGQGGSGILRIRTGGYQENLLAGNQSVELIGGHADCTTGTISGFTAVDGSGAALPALRFSLTNTAAGTSQNLYLSRIDLTGGTGQSDAFPGGGLSVLAVSGITAGVWLDNVWIYNNQTSYHGGGIAVTGGGGGSLLIERNSRVFDNQTAGGVSTPRGGGLSCQHPAGTFQVTLLGGAIHGNTAGTPAAPEGRGGGVALSGCDFTWYSDGQFSGDEAALRDNTAYGNGGGLYATSGARVRLIGAHVPVPALPSNSSRPLRVHGNQALSGPPPGGNGGAVYAEGSGTEVILDRAWIHNNHGQRNGGALSVLGGAVVTVERSSEVCHHPRACSRIFENSAGLVGAAGTVAQAGSELNIRRTIMADNQVEHTVGSPLRSDSTAMLRLEDSLVYGGTGTGYVLMLISGNAEIRRSTIADTRPDVAVFRISGSGVNLTLRDAIVHEQDERDMVHVADATGTIIESACVIWHDDGLAGLGLAAQTMIADPRFIDRDSGQYYLAPGSPAINYCFDTGQPPDLEWNPRGNLHSGQPALHGPVDLGAYEFPLGIFSDRFEAP